jgi:hypothetical protein
MLSRIPAFIFLILTVSQTVSAQETAQLVISHRYDDVQNPAQFKIDMVIGREDITSHISPIERISSMTLKRGVTKTQSNGSVVAMEELTLQTEGLNGTLGSSHLRIEKQADLKVLQNNEGMLLDIHREAVTSTLENDQSREKQDDEPGLAGVVIYSDINSNMSLNSNLLQIRFEPKSVDQQLVGVPAHLFNTPAAGETLIATVNASYLIDGVFEQEVFVYPVEVKELSIRIPVRIKRNQ